MPFEDSLKSWALAISSSIALLNSIIKSKSYISSSLKELLFPRNVLLDIFHSWTSVFFFSLIKKVSHHNLSLHMCLGITINAWWQCRSQLLMTVPKLFIYPNIWQLHTLYILVIWINMHFIFSDHILSEWKFYEIYLCNRVSTGPANCRCSIKMATLQYFTNQAVL